MRIIQSQFTAYSRAKLSHGLILLQYARTGQKWCVGNPADVRSGQSPAHDCKESTLARPVTRNENSTDSHEAKVRKVTWNKRMASMALFSSNVNLW